MIRIDQLNNNVREELSSFKKETNALTSSILDKDGFLIFYDKDHRLNTLSFKTKMVKLFNMLKSLKLINFHERIEYISFEINPEEIGGDDERLYSSGFQILVKAINKNLVLLSVFDQFGTVIDDIIPIFNGVIDSLSNYFSDFQ